MMIIGREAMIKAVNCMSIVSCENYVQKANLCIMIAASYMKQAKSTLFSPKVMPDARTLTKEELETYKEIYNTTKEIAENLDKLSKLSTRYVQDR